MNGTPPLVDVLASVASSERYTTYHGGTPEQIDYILVAPGLNEDLVAGSPKVLHTAVYKNVSDHYPVYSRFTLR